MEELLQNFRSSVHINSQNNYNLFGRYDVQSKIPNLPFANQANLREKKCLQEQDIFTPNILCVWVTGRICTLHGSLTLTHLEKRMAMGQDS